MSLQITDADLKIEICPECRGRKQVEKTTRTSANSTMTQTVNCEACGGRGLKLTPTGAKLFDFVHEASRWSRF
jgi:DnaJ-class molecular chaperone